VSAAWVRPDDRTKLDPPVPFSWKALTVFLSLCAAAGSLGALAVERLLRRR
jgi:hypothetical protein